MFRKKLEQCNLADINNKKTNSNNFWKIFFKRFFKHKLAVSSIVILLIMIILSILVPYIAQYKYDYVDLRTSFPSSPDFQLGHYFGTDSNGRDLLVRLFMGVKISITIGLLGALVAVVLGVMYGSISGYYGGKIDLIMMRIVDILYTIPIIFIIIILVVVFGRDIFFMFMVIGAFSWLNMARIVRGQTISIKNRDFIEAAKAYSLSNSKIIIRHIIPNLLGTVVIYLTLTIPNIILLESFISFLGLGVQEPMTSLGGLINDGSAVIENYIWLFLIPFIFFSTILLCFNFIGDGIRDALDNKSK